MTARTPGPVSVQVDAKIIDGGMIFSQINPFFLTDGVG
jgi:hypothetical protein